MKRALIVIALIIVLYSATVSAVPFKLIVGKEGLRTVDSHDNPFNSEFYFPNKVFVDFAYMNAFKEYNRCGGYWFVEAFDSGILVKRSDNQDICKGGCFSSADMSLVLADKAVVRSENVRTSCSRGHCHPSIAGDLSFIEGKGINSAITSKSGIVNLGMMNDVLSGFVFTETEGNTFVVKSDNPRVMVWVGARDPETPLTTTTDDTSKNIWACYDGDLNKKCDFNEDTDCLANYGDMYKGICCGTDITDCGYVGFFNENLIDAFCTQLANGKWAWIAKENFGEIFSLDSSYCPAKSLVSDGEKFFSASKSFEYKVFSAKSLVSDGEKFFSASKSFEYKVFSAKGFEEPALCPNGFKEVYLFPEEISLETIAGERIRICERINFLDGDSVSVKTRYGNHEYISSAGDLFECAADFPFSTKNNASLGSNTRDLSGLVCPEGIIFYYPLEDSADNFVNQFVNGAPNIISFATGKIGNAALFASPYSDIVIAPDQINLNLDEFSFSAWINPSNIEGKHVVFNSELSVELYLEEGKLKASLYTENSPDGIFLSPTHVIPANQWSFVVLTYDGDKLKLFVNGAQISYADVSGKISQGTKPFIIGARSFEPNEPFEGLIDEVVVYSRALDVSEIKKYVSHLSSYCEISAFDEVFYCASDGDWTKDLDIKDSLSCHSAGFDWTGHRCCSEFDDPGESYSDYSTPAVPIDSLISEQNNAKPVSDYEVLLEGEDSFVTVTGLSRIMVVRSHHRARGEGKMESCLEIEDVITSFDLTKDQVKRIENQFYPDAPYGCTIGKTRVVSLPVLASGGCFDKVFYPTGALLHKNIINYQGEFTACKNIPQEYQSYDFIDVKDSHCGIPLINITRDIHAVCLPEGNWHFTDSPLITVVDDTLWDPIALNVPNAFKLGCCPVDKCWNGTGCQPVNTFYSINGQGFVCK
ncbi:LamG domain-containing protein [Candidatus Woesearchaeota archaeon]|nr:LamG domain-containing protein [Candidatus Woesearchaeota archaeon]